MAQENGLWGSKVGLTGIDCGSGCRFDGTFDQVCGPCYRRGQCLSDMQDVGAKPAHRISVGQDLGVIGPRNIILTMGWEVCSNVCSNTQTAVGSADKQTAHSSVWLDIFLLTLVNIPQWWRQC